MFDFTPEGIIQFDKRIMEINKRIEKLGEEIASSGAETWHDNASYEEATRQQAMWSNELRQLIQIKRKARIVTPSLTGDHVGFGRKVTYEDNMTGEQTTINIGSYIVLNEDSDETSYQSPIAILLEGAEVGETRQGMIAGKRKAFRVIAIA